MAISQRRSKRKVSGTIYNRKGRGKRKYELGRLPTMTKLGKEKRKTIRVRGGNLKTRLIGAEFANLYDPKTKKYQKAKIKTVADNPANKNYVRRNIITKGTIIDTEAGKARITSRPGQDGILNAVLVK
ncbi:30S ribosomal protein S8e [Candidatus Woesearchaeota archaeon]|nr:30S ribosomal protein S8e [Candidatus Woesearchaeota archaeon]